MTARPETRSRGASTPAGPQEANSRASVRGSGRASRWTGPRTRRPTLPREAGQPADAEGDAPSRLTANQTYPDRTTCPASLPSPRPRGAGGALRSPDRRPASPARSAQCAFRPHPFGLDLFALELETLMSAVERLFQRSDHHASPGAPRAQTLRVRRPPADRIRRRRRCALLAIRAISLMPSTAFRTRKPGDSRHQFNQTLSETLLDRGSETSTCRLGRDQLQCGSSPASDARRLRRRQRDRRRRPRRRYHRAGDVRARARLS